MGKLTLAILVLAIALGVYWFWWSDQGANDPITVEGTLSVKGLSALSALPGMPASLRLPDSNKSDFVLEAATNKLRLSISSEGEQVAAIVRLDKRVMYVLDIKKKQYVSQEFELVDMSETEQQEKWEESWPKELKQTAEWDYIGEGDGKWFCNKQTPADLPAGQNVGIELWFTPKTRLGRRQFSIVNKLVRIQFPGNRKPWDKLDSEDAQKIFGVFNQLSAKTESGKRAQLKYVNMDFFPIPLKVDMSFGSLRFNLDVKTLSRKKIPKDRFDVPSGYKEI